jgi:hypothetical protein
MQTDREDIHMQAHSLDETFPFFDRYPIARSAASLPIPALA